MKELNYAIIKELQNYKGMNLSHLWVLEELFKGNQYEDLEDLYQYLIRKRYITTDNHITQLGEEVYKNILSTPSSSVVKKRKKRVGSQEIFDIWWCNYPTNNGWIQPDGKEWTATRTFKNRDKDCEKLYHQFLEYAEYSSDDLINVVDYLVTQMKVATIISNRSIAEDKQTNQLNYFKNTYSFLYNSRVLKDNIPLAREWFNKLNKLGITKEEFIINSVKDATTTKKLYDPKSMF